MRTLKSTQKPLHLPPPQCSCASRTNPGAREVKLNHYGRALEAAFIKRVINELLCFSGSLNSNPSFIHPDLYSPSVCNPNTDMDSGFTSVWRGRREGGGANEKTTGKKKTNKLNNCIHLSEYTAGEGDWTEPIIGCALGRKQNSLLLPVPPKVLIKMPLSFQKKWQCRERKKTMRKNSPSQNRPHDDNRLLWGAGGSLGI